MSKHASQFLANLCSMVGDLNNLHINVEDYGIKIPY